MYLSVILCAIASFLRPALSADIPSLGRVDPKSFEDDNFLTYVFVDSSVLGYTQEQAKSFVTFHLTGSFINKVLTKVPIWYYIRAKTLKPNEDLDLFSESAAKMKAPVHLEYFISQLKNEDLYRFYLLPPGCLRELMFERLKGLEINNPAVLFDPIRNMKGFQYPFRKTLAKDLFPFIEEKLATMPAESWAEIEDIYIQHARAILPAPALLVEALENLSSSSDHLWLRLMSSILFRTYCRRQRLDRGTALIMCYLAAVHPLPGQQKRVLRYLQSVLRTAQSDVALMVIMSAVKRNPFLVLVSDEWKKSELLHPYRTDIVECVLQSLVSGYQRLYQANYVTMATSFLHANSDLIDVKTIEAHCELLNRISKKDRYFPPSLQETSHPLISILAANGVSLPMNLSKALARTSASNSPLNPTTFFKLICDGNVDLILHALSGKHSYLSPVDLHYVRHFVVYIQNVSDDTRRCYEMLPSLKVSNIHNIWDNNSLNIPLQAHKFNSPHTCQAEILASLVFEIGVFSAKDNKGYLKMLRSVGRLYFPEYMARLECVKASCGEKCNIAYLFEEDVIPKNWLLDSYAQFGETLATHRSVENILENEELCSKLIEFVKSGEASHDVKGVYTGLLLDLGLVEERNAIEDLPAAVADMSIYLVEDILSLKDMDGFMTHVFPMLSRPDKYDIVLDLCKSKDVTDNEVTTIAAGLSPNQHRIMNNLFEQAAETNSDVLSKNVFDLHRVLQRDHADYKASMVINHLLEYVKEMERNGDNCEHLLTHGSTMNGLLLTLGTTIANYPTQLFFKAFRRLWDENEALMADSLNTLTSHLASYHGDIGKAVDDVIKQVFGDLPKEIIDTRSQKLLSDCLASPPKTIRGFWKAILNRRQYAHQNAEMDVLFVTIKHGSQSIVVRVPYMATAVDLYLILRPVASLETDNVFALSTMTGSTLLPDNTQLRHLPDKLEFTLHFSDKDTLDKIDLVARHLGFNLAPINRS